MSARLSPQDLDALAAAVAEAEAGTSGEIVVVIARRSHAYPEAVWRAGALGALLALAFASSVFAFYDGWGLGWLHQGWGVAVLTLGAGAAVAGLAAVWPAFRRRLVGEGALAAAVHARALQAFTTEEVFATGSRTGILLYLSLFEHRIEVLADKGISAVVPAEAWGDLVALVRKGIVEDRLADALREAIAKGGALLADAGLQRPPDDTDELPNRLRLYDA